jgi:hypothetical protein
MRSGGEKKPMHTKRKKDDDPEQSKKFIETAKAVEADESGKKFTSALNAIASTKPKKKVTVKPKLKG